MLSSRIDKEWIRCGKCGHKLGKIKREEGLVPSLSIEIKCPSCKELNLVSLKKDEKVLDTKKDS